MPVEPVVTFKNIEPSAALLWDIRDRAKALARTHGPMLGCDVLLEREGGAPRVRVMLSTPRGRVNVTRRPTLGSAARHWALAAMRRHAEDIDPRLQVAVREAFSAARRRLDELTGRPSGARQAVIIVGLFGNGRLAAGH